ncbi:MAG: HAD family hydrolase [Proteobacteria bacterium]|nr:HAD family hydrolase [Pseudomonadota bacterium]
MSKAVFFDRDGVLNADTNYPHLPEHIQWIPGVFEAVKAANEAGYKVFVITNQAGVGRGLYTESHVNALHRWMREEFKKHGAAIDDFAYCPHHPTEGQGIYRVECECRKPKPGMLRELIARHGVNAAESLLIGDRDSDLQAAKAAHIQGCLFTGGDLAEFVTALL